MHFVRVFLGAVAAVSQLFCLLLLLVSVAAAVVCSSGQWRVARLPVCVQLWPASLVPAAGRVEVEIALREGEQEQGQRRQQRALAATEWRSNGRVTSACATSAHEGGG